MRSTGAPRRGRQWHVMVMAKSPVPGKVKTRLCPPLTPQQAASVAEACLADTFEAVTSCSAERRIVALDGDPGPWLPPGFEVVRQRGISLDHRLAAAWHDAGGPGLQIGMDTPQVSARLLDHCLEQSAMPGASASLGPATDGGWWAIALARGWDIDVFTGVPMSTAVTAAAQRRRLVACGHRVRSLPTLRDVDRVDDAEAVASLVPHSRFARTLTLMETVAC
jgi:glycosyltransferase A (GT-A) superfamily protein (DUF2064 family)